MACINATCANILNMIDMTSKYAHTCELWHEGVVMIHCHILMIKHISYSVSIDGTDHELYFQLTEMSEIIIIIGYQYCPMIYQYPHILGPLDS